MDWLQFFASIVGSLAWPMVLSVFLWMIRNQLPILLSRIIELHLPGGAKAIFAEALDSARDVAEAVRPEAVREGRWLTLDHAPDPEKLRYARWYPLMMINEAYTGLEKILAEIRSKVGLSERMNFSSIMMYLVEKKLIDGSIFDLFESLRRARNAAVHTHLNQITSAEALEFATQAEILEQILKDVSKKLTG